MDRFTISLDENLATAFDELIKNRGYATRSEAVRDILRTHLQHNREQRDAKGQCVANLSEMVRSWLQIALIRCIQLRSLFVKER